MRFLVYCRGMRALKPREVHHYIHFRVNLTKMSRGRNLLRCTINCMWGLKYFEIPIFCNIHFIKPSTIHPQKFEYLILFQHLYEILKNILKF